VGLIHDLPLAAATTVAAQVSGATAAAAAAKATAAHGLPLQRCNEP